MTRREEPPQDALFDVDLPESPPPQPSAGLLVKAWVDGWTDRQGKPPHPGVVKRVAGVCAQVGKTCTSVEEWRDAWQAALTAGRQGRYDIVDVLASGERRDSLYAVPRARDVVEEAMATSRFGRGRKEIEQ